MPNGGYDRSCDVDLFAPPAPLSFLPPLALVELLLPLRQPRRRVLQPSFQLAQVIALGVDLAGKLLDGHFPRIKLALPAVQLLPLGLQAAPKTVKFLLHSPGLLTLKL